MTRLISPSDPLHVLLVEDVKGDAILIERALTFALPEAYVMQRVGTLTKALKALSERHFDVVLLDRSLPDVSGFSGLLNIQNMAPTLPVVFLTAFKDETVALSAVENGAQDYLFKDKADGHTIKRAIQFAIHRKQFESVLITQANFDGLTGLANRVSFEGRLDMLLARMHRNTGGVGVFFADLDGFKQVNDTHGHGIGDQVLKEVAKRLKYSVRPYDTVARFGGDEFAVLIEGGDKYEHCVMIAEKIIQLMTEPFIVNSLQLKLGISVGITTCVDSTVSREQLLLQADSAMYEAKASNLQKYVFYNVDMQQLLLSKPKIKEYMNMDAKF